MTLKAIFNAGPAALPDAVFTWLKSQIPDAEERFESVMEIGHRTPRFEEILEGLKQNIKKLYMLDTNYAINFFQGGANTQFGALPLNFRNHKYQPLYVQTGRWSERAVEDAALVLAPKTLWNGHAKNYTNLPTAKELNQKIDDHSYLYYTTNETVHGIQFDKSFCQDLKSRKQVVDMSSDILTRPVDFKNLAYIFACAQKNLGISGVTLVISRKDFVEEMDATGLPRMLNLSLQIEHESCFNTPPVLAIAVAKVVTDWTLEEFGSLAEVEAVSMQKAQLVYQQVEKSAGFYECIVEKRSRSQVNAVFTLANPRREPDFIAAAKTEGFVGIKGHKALGGIRVSMYNSISIDQVRKFVQFMDDFSKKPA